MQFQLSKIVSTLLLLNIGICSAMYQFPLKIEHPDQEGAFMIRAECKGRSHSRMALINKAAECLGIGWINYVKWKIAGENLVEYIPTADEKMNYRPPYYVTPLRNLDSDNLGGYQDLLIFTKEGKIEKVVTRYRGQDPVSGRYPIQLEICRFVWTLVT